ncbi:MAG: stage V sporulation protein AA [Lachnospiraceae bacterium]
MSEILYIKIDQNIEVDHIDVRLGDVAKLECTNASVKNRLKTLKLLKIQAEKSSRYIFSILKVVELIHEIYPDLEIQNLGETDFIIDYESSEYARDRWSFVKVALVCVTIFIGSAFSIMTFNNDVGVSQVFDQVYLLLTGQQSDGFTILEVTYSVGIAVGIIIFYNHFGGKRITKDPTPMEVQIRQYEDDVNTTLIEGCNRKETSIDVD